MPGKCQCNPIIAVIVKSSVRPTSIVQCAVGQETADNKLVVLHDLDRVVRHSAASPVNSAAIAALRQQGITLEGARVRVSHFPCYWGAVQGKFVCKRLHMH